MSAVPASIRKRLRLPVIQAPMFRVSGPDMVIGACRAGIVGSFPASNARSIEELDDWYRHISTQVTQAHAPWAANVIVHQSNPRREAELELVYRYRPEILITALGSPRSVVEAVQAYGGLALADVNSPRQAQHAAGMGVDGLVILCAGAGGYTGSLSPFAFIEEVRAFFDGLVVLAGGINTGRSIHAAEVAGADLAYMGTQFIASEESSAQKEYKAMLIAASSRDVLVSDQITGAAASWLVPSLQANGIDPGNLPDKPDFDFREQIQGKRWKDLWSAGHGVNSVSAERSVGSIVEQLVVEYRQSRDR